MFNTHRVCMAMQLIACALYIKVLPKSLSLSPTNCVYKRKEEPVKCGINAWDFETMSLRIALSDDTDTQAPDKSGLQQLTMHVGPHA